MMFFYYFIKKYNFSVIGNFKKKLRLKFPKKVFNLNQIFLLTFFYIYVNI